MCQQTKQVLIRFLHAFYSAKQFRFIEKLPKPDVKAYSML